MRIEGILCWWNLKKLPPDKYHWLSSEPMTAPFTASGFQSPSTRRNRNEPSTEILGAMDPDSPVPGDPRHCGRQRPRVGHGGAAVTRYTPEGESMHSANKQQAIRHQEQVDRLLKISIDATIRITRMKSDLDAAARLVQDAGLTSGHATTLEDLMREVLAELAKVASDRDKLKELVDDAGKGLVITTDVYRFE